MDPSEQALASLLDEGESLEETWTVDTISRGFELAAPGLGSRETLGLTGKRLVWLDEEFETVDLEAVESVETNAVSQSPTSILIVIGVLGIVLGTIVTPLLWVFTSLSMELTLAPLVVGLLALVLGVVGTRLWDREDAEQQHYLDVKTMTETIQIYATEATVETITERIRSETE
ncbi:hypothetical protein [Halorhabdus sp. BNX81]|uniref:hypothetical protein n=1 Tax=Halorhabdus sp. BNX81 TaxID=2980181 RepID=UPI0023DCECE9|nr:hypothetical protein [Halorhabdus sp. BNX81]WEL21467.1 putative membrane protein [Halorhabdus sp. BNX81]